MTSSLPASRSTPAKATELHAKASPNFADKLAETQALLQRAATDFAPVTQASSLGAEDVVITHLINHLQLDIPVFVLDTGALHTETLALLERLQAHSRAPIQVYRPAHESVIAFVREQGQDAMYRSIALRKACCGVRKMAPLRRALSGQKAWITGLRQEQSDARAEVPLLDDSELHNALTSDTDANANAQAQNQNQTQIQAQPRAQAQAQAQAQVQAQAQAQVQPQAQATSPSSSLYKFNPLTTWTWGDVWHYIAQNQVDYNPLHDQFFPSIGCAPCTRAISLGEAFRAGRWWWEDESAKECGLHAKP